MREIIFVRHGLTQWNMDKKIQGQTDIPLSPEGINQVKSWNLPQEYHPGKWFSSPLQRTRQTASLLGAIDIEYATPLIEMNWGRWDGCTLHLLREQLGDVLRQNERRGLDFQPPDGESPRMVRARLAGWLQTLPEEPQPVVIVTHKGVIRAAISHATGWDLKSDFGEKLKRDAFHRFRLGAGGSMDLVELNRPLK